MSEQMHRHIYELNMSWGKFQDATSLLNKERQENDEGFAARNFIGEEVYDPTETGYEEIPQFKEVR